MDDVLKMNALARMEVEILLKRTAIFSCTGKATKGSSCECLEKKQFFPQDCNEQLD